MAQFRATYDVHSVYAAKPTLLGNRQQWQYVTEFHDILAAYEMRKQLRATGYDVEIRYKKHRKEAP